MGKRANTKTAATSAAKRVKADPGLSAIADAIMEAEHIPKRCREMLTELLPLSLSVALDERHSLQKMAVDMVEETFQGKKSALEAAIAAEDEKLANLKGSEAELGRTVKESDDALAAQKEVVQTAKDALVAATAAEQDSLKALNERREEQRSSGEKLARAQEAKTALEKVFEEHFKPIEDGASGAHFKQLEPFLQQIEIEATLLTALPSSCAKSKQDRGSFDHLVIEELQKAIASKITALGDEVVAGTPATAQLDAAVQAAVAEHEAKKAAQTQCAAGLDAAVKEQTDREATLSKARLAVDDFQPQVDRVTGEACKAKDALGSFERGPLSSFAAYKTKLAAQPETAPEAVPEAVPEAPPEKTAPAESAPVVEAAGA